MSNLRTFLFAGPNQADRWSDISLTLLRLYTGLALAFAHGINKLPPAEGFVDNIAGMGFPAAGLIAWFVAIGEFLGGLFLALGLMTRAAAFLVVVNMFMIAFVFHVIIQGDPFSGYRLALFYMFGALPFLIRGAGPYSVDAFIRGRSKEAMQV